MRRTACLTGAVVKVDTGALDYQIAVSGGLKTALETRADGTVLS